ncbi:hypothetical protein FRC01_006799, partial [Tulasnella sp. 417]
MASSGAAPSSFLDHLLTLVASYDSGTALPQAYPHASTKEAAVEQAIAELAKRLKRPVDTSSLSTYSAASNGGSSMDWKPHGGPPTPESTPGASNGSSNHAPHGTKNPSSYFCPTCGRAPSADSEQPLHDSGPVGISATDELQLLKAQVQDVARVCK